jgi:hypothetical protein
MTTANKANRGGSGRPKSLLNRRELPAATIPTTTIERTPALPTIKLKGILRASHQPIMSRTVVIELSRRQRAEPLRRANRPRGCGSCSVDSLIVCSPRGSRAQLTDVTNLPSLPESQFWEEQSRDDNRTCALDVAPQCPCLANRSRARSCGITCVATKDAVLRSSTKAHQPQQAFLVGALL